MKQQQQQVSCFVSYSSGISFFFFYICILITFTNWMDEFRILVYFLSDFDII